MTERLTVKHTPTPWEVGEFKEQPYVCAEYGGRLVADTFGGTLEEAQANAALIVQAVKAYTDHQAAVAELEARVVLLEGESKHFEDAAYKASQASHNFQSQLQAQAEKLKALEATVRAQLEALERTGKLLATQAEQLKRLPLCPPCDMGENTECVCDAELVPKSWVPSWQSIETAPLDQDVDLWVEVKSDKRQQRLTSCYFSEKIADWCQNGLWIGRVYKPLFWHPKPAAPEAALRLSSEKEGAK